MPRKIISKKLLREGGYESIAAGARTARIPYGTFYDWVTGAHKPRNTERVEKARERVTYYSPIESEKRTRRRAREKRARAVSTREEIAGLVALASAGGVNSVIRPKTEKRGITAENVYTAGRIVFQSQPGSLRLIESFSKIRRRFVDWIKSYNTAETQLQGLDYYDSFSQKTDRGLEDYAQAFTRELVQAFDLYPVSQRILPLGHLLSPDEVKTQRAEGRFFTSQPMHFQQVILYCLDLPEWYFAVQFVETGTPGDYAIEIWELSSVKGHTTR